MVNNRTLVWDKAALSHLKEIYDFLKKEDGLVLANKVKNAILNATKELVEKPDLFRQDRFKIDNDGSFRAFESSKYRVAYKISEKQIRILRIRHTSSEPIEY